MLWKPVCVWLGEHTAIHISIVDDMDCLGSLVALCRVWGFQGKDASAKHHCPKTTPMGDGCKSGFLFKREGETVTT